MDRESLEIDLAMIKTCKEKLEALEENLKDLKYFSIRTFRDRFIQYIDTFIKSVQIIKNSSNENNPKEEKSFEYFDPSDENKKLQSHNAFIEFLCDITSNLDTFRFMEDSEKCLFESLVSFQAFADSAKAFEQASLFRIVKFIETLNPDMNNKLKKLMTSENIGDQSSYREIFRMFQFILKRNDSESEHQEIISKFRQAFSKELSITEIKNAQKTQLEASYSLIKNILAVTEEIIQNYHKLVTKFAS